jgi:transaldolase
MTDSYFLRLRATTPTRMWVNNPTLGECELAIAQGAAGCTTNPAYGGGLLKRAPEYVTPIIDEAVRDAAAGEPAAVIAERVQERLVGEALATFRPLWDASGGREGLVSIQGSPESDHDGRRISEAAHRARELAPNAVPKIPATVPGIEAFEEMVALGSPTIVTEVFSLDQVVYTCDAYLRASARSGATPPFFMSPITGIFADQLKKVARRDGIPVDASVIDWTGVILARACLRLVHERGYPVTLLFGGARLAVDFTGLVGDATGATINYSTIDEIVRADPIVRTTVTDPVEPALVATLADAFVDFRKGLQLGSLTPGEFEGFGPVEHFRDAFVVGWRAVVDAIASRRDMEPAPGLVEAHR